MRIPRLLFRRTVSGFAGFLRCDFSLRRHALPGAWIFLKGLALVYLSAFASFWSQAEGLIGERGILPMARLFEAYGRVSGVDRFWNLPSVFWLNTSDIVLHAVCGAGVVASLMLLAGLLPFWSLLVCWGLYLSIQSAGQVFMSFQWDSLLSEVGLLSLTLVPIWSLCMKAADLRTSRPVVFLFRLLLFKLMFLSGIVKLLSGDELWYTGRALLVHFETQPLPSPLSWYFHNFPDVVLQWFCYGMFFIELAIPFYVFNNRFVRWLGVAVLFELSGKLNLPGEIVFQSAVVMGILEVLYLAIPRGAVLARRIGFTGLFLLQVLIYLTGNYTFFNLLTMLLCLWAMDASDWPTFVRRHVEPGFPDPSPCKPLPRMRWAYAPAWALVVLFSFMIMAGTLGYRGPWPAPLSQAYKLAAPFRSANGYGLFAVMTPTRPEITVEGTYDGRTWMPYNFRFKPGPPTRRLPVVAPHQPRLDWQMWFASLGSAQGNPWFMHFLVRLLEGSPEVLALLDDHPFTNGPPVAVRAKLERYRLTTPAQRRADGTLWTVEPLGPYIEQPIMLAPPR